MVSSRKINSFIIMNNITLYIQEKLKINSKSKIDTEDKIEFKKPDAKSAKIMFDACMASENDQFIYKKFFDPLVQNLLMYTTINLEKIENSEQLLSLTNACLSAANNRSQKLSSYNKKLLNKYILANILKSMVAFDHEQTKEEEDYMIEWDFYNGPNKLEW